MYNKELSFLKDTVLSAYDIYCSDPVLVSQKAEFDVVTNIDKAIETFFSKRLLETFPQDRLHGEEFSSSTKLEDRTWILDPIDGTFNFASQSAHFGIQAAFWDRGALQVSLIYLPRFKEVYHAVRGEGSYRNGERIHVSSRRAKDAIFSFGDLPHARPNDAKDQRKIMDRAYERISRMRMFGAACIDFTSVASGKTEGVVLFTRNKWDIAPGLLLATEAGAKAYGISGEEYTFESRGIFVCNQDEIYQELMEGLDL
jgi:myo-inositol-1(or 4)-monophosphatase